MLQYVDSFFCTYNEAKEAYVFRLRQEEPVEGDSPDKIAVQTNEIANVIMDKQCAIELARSILQLITPESETVVSEDTLQENSENNDAESNP